ncbi:hypothetical protein [Pseudomonas petrae]|uniref:Lipoprotein n=1 Tax=Pseudomonas petrae TaxID=2912190 RepID=A0ABS9I5P9_9PSED|nr:hypothetical protein [Pseudomonas petrae]MCF7535510.1 hypothetical protein [Pseudomonas petrae]MCF7543102.1 hypothetical protein [Pseudomonas petrae]MCF7558851.1 hypothetical protein [Pseudomonas petrae]
MKKLFLALMSVALLSGCVTKSLSVEDRSQIKTIKVLPVYFSLESFKYTSMTQAWGAGLGAGAGAATGMAAGASSAGTSALTGAGSVAGTKAANGAKADISQAILNNMQAHGIDLGQLVRESFEKRIKREGLFTIVAEGEKADADVELMVSQWGLCLKNFSTVLYPVIGVNGSMKRNGTSVWRNFDTISVFNETNTVAFTPQQYATNPEALRAVFSHVTDLAVSKLIENLKQ